MSRTVIGRAFQERAFIVDSCVPEGLGCDILEFLNSLIVAAWLGKSQTIYMFMPDT